MQSVSRHIVLTLSSVFRSIGPSLCVHAGMQFETKICAFQSPKETISGPVSQEKVILRWHIS